jgi:hypothetical protein
MNNDPRTVGGVRPRETVELVRTAAHASGPQEDRMDRPALSAAGVLAKGGDAARHAVRVPAAPPPAARDIAAGERELDSTWGAKAERNAAAFARYYDSLPAAERARIDADPWADDPAFVQELMGQALRPQPAAQTIEGIEAFIRTNRSAYTKDEPLQARYRELVEAREQAGGKGE